MERNDPSFARWNLIVAAANSLARALMEADPHDLVSRLVEIILADEINGMANTGVRRHGMRATVLSKIGSATEEGSDVLECDDAGTAVLVQADKEEISKVMNRASQGIMNENLSRGKEGKRATALRKKN